MRRIIMILRSRPPLPQSIVMGRVIRKLRM